MQFLTKIDISPTPPSAFVPVVDILAVAVQARNLLPLEFDGKLQIPAAIFSFEIFVEAFERFEIFTYPVITHV